MIHCRAQLKNPKYLNNQVNIANSNPVQSDSIGQLRAREFN